LKIFGHFDFQDVWWYNANLYPTLNDVLVNCCIIWNLLFYDKTLWGRFEDH